MAAEAGLVVAVVDSVDRLVVVEAAEEDSAVGAVDSAVDAVDSVVIVAAVRAASVEVCSADELFMRTFTKVCSV